METQIINLDDARAENTAFELLEIRQSHRAKQQVTFLGGKTYEVPVKDSNDEK